MMSEQKNRIQKLLEGYFTWLHDRTSLCEVDGQWMEITTPYLDRHNDHIQIYAKETDNGFLLTDSGYTIGDLRSSGCELNSPTRQDLLKTILNGFGIRLQDDTLEVCAKSDDFALRKHNLVQAILAVNDIFYLSMSI